MDAAGRRRGRGKGWEALMSVDVVDDIYEGSHRVGVYLVNGRQILLVPILDIDCRSDAAEIYDYPMEPAVLGGLVRNLLIRWSTGISFSGRNTRTIG